MFEEVGRLIDNKEEPGNLDQAITLLQDLKKEHPEKDIIRGKLSHAYYYKARFSPEKSKERENFFDLGTNSGKEAITLNPRAVYGNYWYAANLGMLGYTRGIMASLKSINPMRNAVEIVLEENEHFFFAGPHRMMGRLYHQAPGWPISIGKKSKAVDHLERAVTLAPHFFHNRLFLIELLLDMGKKKEALEHIEWMEKTPLNPAHKIEDGEYRDQAVKLKSKYY